ncbi:ABC transporter permease [Athalassotoga saccharophila]|uniref:ABC transporter permease n=1 Tax=Athalassotoga saccharophila TaxID=1441386 RepID=UPI00137B0148|nr:ABC transporter permease subunit [Athalassotoga saccharophila]BBJ27658.1 bicarbonate transport system permease protein CmpB [Athalassotoga saccharophila]
MVRAIEKKILHFSIYDAVVVAILVFLTWGVIELATRWTGTMVAQATISMSPIALIGYTLLSMSRGFIAYGFSLIFTLTYGYAAARNRYAERLLIPLLDILQSVPVLGFLPGVLLAMIAIFPHSNIGLELASIIMIFTGQVWNMTFSFYQSLKSIPRDLIEASKIYGFSKWKIFWNVEVPYSMPGLVWNSMMSMAGGWFFLVVSEYFSLGDKTFILPGVGSYMGVAMDKGYVPGEIYAIIAMMLMILAIDFFFWRPIVAWADKFKMDEVASEDEPKSLILKVLKSSHALMFFRELTTLRKITPKFKPRVISGDYQRDESRWGNILFYSIIGLISFFGIWKLLSFFSSIKGSELLTILFADGITGLRVYTAVAISMWALPVGIIIGKNMRLSKRLQPVIQMIASFPAPMIYPWFVLIFPNLNWSSIILMLLGTQWYILFNVIAGASAIPNQLKEAAKMLKFTKKELWFNLYIPSVLPYLITGMITAAGGAWNASIVAEYMVVGGHTYTATGIGYLINVFTNNNQMNLLALSVIVMSVGVVTINKLMWRPLQKWSTEKFKFD